MGTSLRGPRAARSCGHSSRRELRLSGAAGVLLALHFATWVPSLRLTSVASSVALVCLQPVWVVLIAMARGHAVPAAAWVGIAIAFGGVLLLTGVDAGRGGDVLLGDLLALLGGMAAAGYVTVGGEVRRTVSTSPYTLLCYGTCAVLLAVVCVVAGTPFTGYSAADWSRLVLLTFLAQLLGHTLANVVLRTTSPTVVSLAILFEVPGSIVIAALLVGQVPPCRRAPCGGADARWGRPGDPVAGHRGAGARAPRLSAVPASTDSVPGMVDRPLRPRRSCLAVPGSSLKMIDKARGLPADQVFLDLEDACAPLAKPEARGTIVAALNEGGWGEKTRVVRVNDWTTHWTYRDVIQVVEGAGANLDCIMLPKVQTAQQVVALDLLLTQIEKTMGYEVGRIGIEAQIENARGLLEVDAIAQASPRVETIIFGPADFMASINMKSLVVGEQPPGYDVGDAYHHILMSILMAARANEKQAIDGPYLQIRDVEGFSRVAGRSAALGFDGKWALHPGQIDAANEAYSPRQEDYDHAELILDAYDWYTSAAGGARGAAMLGDEMIDEASRKMALVIAAKGRAAAMSRTESFTPPE